jgi:hypothetical protein
MGPLMLPPRARWVGLASLAALALALTPSGATAQRAGNTPPTRSLPRVLGWVVSPGPSGTEGALLQRRLEERLASSGRFELVSLADALDPTAAGSRREQLEAGRAAAAAGMEAYNELDAQRALKFFDRAIRAFEQVDLSWHFGELSQAWLMKIASLVANGEGKAAQLQIERLLSIAPGVEFSSQYFPPETLAFAERARKGLQQTTMELRPTPADAVVFVDGVAREPGTVSVSSAALGEHYVVATAPGFELLQRKARHGRVDLPLGAAPEAAALAQALEQARKDPAGPGRDQAGRALARLGGVEQVVIAVLPGGPAGQGYLLRVDVSDGHNLGFARAKGRELEAFEGQWSTVLEQDAPRGPRGGPVSHHQAAPGPGWSRKHTGYALLGAGAALLAGGVFFGLQAAGQHDTFRTLAQTDGRVPELGSQGRTYAILADLTVIAGLAAAGGGGYLVFGGPSGASPAAAPPADTGGAW